MRRTDVQDMRARNTDAKEFICKCVIYAALMIAAVVSMRMKDQLRQRLVWRAAVGAAKGALPIEDSGVYGQQGPEVLQA